MATKENKHKEEETKTKQPQENQDKEGKKDDKKMSENKSSKEDSDKKKSSKKTKKEKKADVVAELESALNQKNDQFLRLQAEFDNYRKRTLKEKMELTKSAGESVLTNILPVIDDFERAIKMMEDAKEKGAIKEGIDLIYKRFKDFLNQNGVKEIEAIEKDFDTDIHEAVTKIPAPKKELKGKVVDVIQKGYILNEKVIRFAKVVIGE